MPIAKNPRAKKLGAGVHLASIVSIQYAKNFEGILLENRSGENALEVRFKNAEGKDIHGRFWLSENAEWILKEFYKAIDIDPEKELDVSEVIGNKLWIYVAEKHVTKAGKTSIYFEVLPKFSKLFTADDRPVIAGDPVREGKPSGIFFIEENYDVKELPKFEETDEIPWHE